MLRCKTHDNAIRWLPGERLHHLFEHRCDRLARDGIADHLAIDAADGALSFAELDRCANSMARHLLASGLRPGCRIGLLVDKSSHAYVGLLAILKIDAAYVPMDQSYPPDRIDYIARDAGLSAVLTVAAFNDRVAALHGGTPVIVLEEAAPLAAVLPSGRLGHETATGAADARNDDALSYIVYTSGSTGNPKGVAVDHSSICNFVRVAAEVYGYRPDDRVYQGMTLAFDFSVEELWVPLIAGATLVPARSDATLIGNDLAKFLTEKRVTGLCCVPTLLATITSELPALRFLLVSGEACPHDLVVRWSRPGRRMLNAYGPTEATVTASWTELDPAKPVTIGVPLPTYTMMILGEGGQSQLPDGEIGEIGIAGIGLARGYVNREDLTAAAFVPDFIGLDDNPSHRIYRTGDLGRINALGEIEYHGRIDTQVKVRGYRIELTEIESKLLEFPGVAQAVVKTHKTAQCQTELAAFFTRSDDSGALDARAIAGYLRGRLPGYMIPAYIEEIAEIPMLPSHKADRKKLPDPAGGRIVAAGAEYVPPQTATEAAVAEAFGATLGLDAVSVADHFFNDLGANSLIMAEFIARLQQAIPGRSVAIADAYLNPDVRRLAAHLEVAAPRRAATPAQPATPPVRATRLQHAVCGVLQYAYYVAYGFIYLVLAVEIYGYQDGATDWVQSYVSAVLSSVVFLALLVAVPIAAKWLLIGRFREERIPLWSLAYYRFWVVKQLVQTNPMAFFRGQPIFNWYLRLLGARIGRNAVVNTRHVPLATDLLRIGEGAVLAKDTLVQGYRAENGVIVVGPIAIGRDAYVGEASVIDIGTVIGDGGQLAHVSSLQPGQSVPADGRYHGSPAVPTSGEFIPVDPVACSSLRRWVFTIVVIGLLIGIVMPALELVTISASHWAAGLGAAALDTIAPGTGAHETGGPETGAPGTWAFASWAAWAQAAAVLQALAFGSLALFLAGTFGGLAMVVLVPRLLSPLIALDKTYPLYGFHHGVTMLSTWMSNSYFFNIVFGDSSFIVYYLRWIGYRLGVVKQTGSNFGSAQKHDVADACDIGSGTMVSDGLSMINVRQSNSSFRVSRVVIPESNFLGNQIVYIAGARVGSGNLLATKVMVPLDGPVLSETGLLGSPPFEIPRQVVTERAFDPLAETPQRYSRLAAKNRHNAVTLAYYLLLLWLYSLLSLALAYLAFQAYGTWGYGALLAFSALAPAVTIAYFLAMERLGPGWLTLEPRSCTIHDLHFWKVERYWKMGETPLKLGFKGTPFRPWIYRMLGVEVGQMVFDDGCTITEKALTALGDHSCLNEATSIQCHSLEDGLFKSDRVRIGRDANLAPGAFLNYAVTVGDGASIQADSFVMKGSVVAPGQIWAGNPARQA